MSDLTPTQMGNRIANSLTGYIAHIPGSVSCRHCELAQEIADALRAVEQATERWVWEKAAIEIYNRHVNTCRYLLATSREPCPCESIMPTYDEFRRLAAGGG